MEIWMAKANSVIDASGNVIAVTNTMPSDGDFREAMAAASMRAEIMARAPDQARIIDALVAALEMARSSIAGEWGEDHPEVAEIDAALAMARKGG